MRRFLPRSLAGQMALLLGLALFVAQLANFALILNERQKLSLAQNEGPAITRFAGVAADFEQAAPEFRAAVLADSSHRGARFALGRESGVAEGARQREIEARLSDALTDAGLGSRPVRAATALGESFGGRGPSRDLLMLHLAARRPDGTWLSARLIAPRRDPVLTVRLAAATLLLYLIVLGATVWIATRIARPLRALTRAADRFAGRSDPVALEPSGPADVARAIAAFNAMNRRVVTLLDEKDRMLGAIGHDLRTPLASLRIRVESMEPEEERDAVVAKIEEMTAMLEDILVLARSGRTREAARDVDVAALVEATVEEYRALGAPVTFIPSGRHVAAVHAGLLRRAVRNLIDNAVRYGGGAEVAVTAGAGATEIRVRDAGPGIPAEEIERVLQPFYRLETSRNRGTGGTGLGLAIAQSIAESHGGRLRLESADPVGLVATIILPHAGGGPAVSPLHDSNALPG